MSIRKRRGLVKGSGLQEHAGKPRSSEEKSDTSKKVSDPHKKKFRDSKRFIFTLGTFLGVVVAFYFGASHVHNNNLDLFDNMVNFDVVNDYLDDWKDVLPAGVSTFLTEFQKGQQGGDSLKNMAENFAVGKQLKTELNLEAAHPVVMIPGVISTGIESWGVDGDDVCDSSPHFRRRLWGSYYMLKVMVLDKVCWLKHLMLDPDTGLDPPHFRLRASQGFESSDFFVAGYWIWNKVIQNLGAIGYDPDKMATAAYDWRLAYLDLERRDKYFSRMKTQIELTYELNQSKVTLIGHSMGSQIVFYFLKWVEAEGPNYGNGGPDWVDKHIDSFINVAGTLLGAPKAVPAMISGEMKDTIQLNALAMYGLEKFFSRKERLEMIQTWGGIPSMIPKGGQLIWGSPDFSLDDELRNTTDAKSSGAFISFERDSPHYDKRISMDKAINLMLDMSPKWLRDRINDQYDYDYATTPEELEENKKNHKYWTNPLQVPLPNAPDLKIYCIYGVGNPTERAYVYKEDKDSSLNITIDYESDEAVILTNGDGTVPLLSHAMCHKWAEGQSPYNPAGANVTIVEIKHQPDRYDIRGGAKSAEHVDILGSAELNEYILRIASGHGDTIRPRQISRLADWVRNITFPM